MNNKSQDLKKLLERIGIKGVMKMSKKLKTNQLATTFAVWSTLLMLVLWLLGNAGFYLSAVEQMQKWHMFFDLSIGGLIGGAIEAAIISYVLVYTFVWVYNRVAKML